MGAGMVVMEAMGTAVIMGMATGTVGTTVMATATDIMDTAAAEPGALRPAGPG